MKLDWSATIRYLAVLAFGLQPSLALPVPIRPRTGCAELNSLISSAEDNVNVNVNVPAEYELLGELPSNALLRSDPYDLL